MADCRLSLSRLTVYRWTTGRITFDPDSIDGPTQSEGVTTTRGITLSVQHEDGLHNHLVRFYGRGILHYVQIPPPRQITCPNTIFKLRQNGGFKSNGREGGGQ